MCATVYASPIHCNCSTTRLSAATASHALVPGCLWERTPLAAADRRPDQFPLSLQLMWSQVGIAPHGGVGKEWQTDGRHVQKSNRLETHELCVSQQGHAALQLCCCRSQHPCLAPSLPPPLLSPPLTQRLTHATPQRADSPSTRVSILP
jgi:hypothetical protein